MHPMLQGASTKGGCAHAVAWGPAARMHYLGGWSFAAPRFSCCSGYRRHVCHVSQQTAYAAVAMSRCTKDTINLSTRMRWPDCMHAPRLACKGGLACLLAQLQQLLP
jgi:hypothetical protein